MKAILILISLLCFELDIRAQTAHVLEEDLKKTFFSEQIQRYYIEYKQKSNRAFALGLREDAQFYYQELVNKYLIGSFMDNFSIDCLNDNSSRIGDFKKPLILLTYASWNVPTKGEVPAINDLASKYREQLDFAVLFWNQKKEVEEVSKMYNKHVEILYVDELQNKDAYTVKMLKHSLGFPTIFVMASNKQIINITRNPQNSWDLEDQEAVQNSLDYFNNLITEIENFEGEIANNISE